MIHVLMAAAILTAPDPRAPAPSMLIVATSRGVTNIPVALDAGYPSLPVAALQRVLPITSRLDGDWAEVDFARQTFRFLLGIPVMSFRNEFQHLVGGAYIRGDAVFVPMQWLVGTIPALLSESFRYDEVAGRFEEVGMTVVAAAPLPAVPDAASRLGLKRPHRVVIDAGHGGPDAGTAGRFLPLGMQEKHVALAIAKELETALTLRGIDVVMTRRTDIIVPFRRRARMCAEDCDLFVSVHVNSLNDSRRNRTVRGVETYFYRENLTSGISRVAAQENASLRYESGIESEDDDDPLSFILKDLARNEYLRESADAAKVVHEFVSDVHPAGSRRLAQADFAVLREAIRPAILVETGYGSNQQDGAFLASSSGKRRLATAIADGIIEYLRRYEDRTSTTLQSR